MATASFIFIQARCVACSGLKCCYKKQTNNNQNGSGGSRCQGHCNNCGKYGHKEAFCWEKEENAHKRPCGWVSRMGEDETSALNYEILVANVDIWNKFGVVTASMGAKENDVTAITGG